MPELFLLLWGLLLQFLQYLWRAAIRYLSWWAFALYESASVSLETHINKINVKVAAIVDFFVVPCDVVFNGFHVLPLYFLRMLDDPDTYLVEPPSPNDDRSPVQVDPLPVFSHDQGRDEPQEDPRSDPIAAWGQSAWETDYPVPVFKRGRGRGSSLPRRPQSPPPTYRPSLPLPSPWSPPPSSPRTRVVGPPLPPAEIHAEFVRRMGSTWNCGVGLVPSGHSGVENDPIIARWRQECREEEANQLRAAVRQQAAEQYRLQVQQAAEQEQQAAEQERLRAQEAAAQAEAALRFELAEQEYYRQVNKLAAFGPRLLHAVDLLETSVSNARRTGDESEVKELAQAVCVQLLAPVKACLDNMLDGASIPLETNGAKHVLDEWPCQKLIEAHDFFKEASACAREYQTFVEDLETICFPLHNAPPFVDPHVITSSAPTLDPLALLPPAAPFSLDLAPNAAPSLSQDEPNFSSFTAFAAASQPAVPVQTSSSSELASAATAPTGPISFATTAGPASSTLANAAAPAGPVSFSMQTLPSRPQPTSSTLANAAAPAGPVSFTMQTLPSRPLQSSSTTGTAGPNFSATGPPSPGPADICVALSRFKTQHAKLIPKFKRQLINEDSSSVDPDLCKQFIELFGPIHRIAKGQRKIVIHEHEGAVRLCLKTISERVLMLPTGLRDQAENKEMIRIVDGVFAVWKAPVIS